MNDGGSGARLHMLLAEDDAVSQCFFAETLAALGCDVDACTRGDEALLRAQERPYDLLLLDVRLPGLGGAELLARLRADPRAASRNAAAVASSAALDTAQQRALLAAGFAGTLLKPTSVAALEALVEAQRLRLGRTLLDDAAALRALGPRRETMAAMRGLLAVELMQLAGDFEHRLRHDPAALIEPLHRLQAACGFCGVPQLAAAAAALERSLLRAAAEPAPEATRFGALLAATRAALDHADTATVNAP